MRKTTEPGDMTTTGLTVTGMLSYRKRRKFPKKDGGFRYNISLGFLTKDGMVECERWSDTPEPADTPETGETVSLPVVLQRFTTKLGQGMRLVWGGASDSETF